MIMALIGVIIAIFLNLVDANGHKIINKLHGNAN
jgi:hypothetical protein